MTSPLRAVRVVHLRASRLVLALAACLVVAAPPMAGAFEREAAPVADQGLAPEGMLVADCFLKAFNTCAGWIWVFNDVEGAEWGAVMSAAECPGGCLNGGAIVGVNLYSRCSTVPGRIGGIKVHSVDAIGCRTSLFFQSGPMDVVHCVTGDRWTHIQVPITHSNGNPFAISVVWGPQPGGTSNPQLSTDNGIGNLYCRLNPGTFGVFPGCAASTSDCSWWTVPPQRTFIYVTDINGDGILDDFCSIYGAPYPLAFPYVYPYGYLPNNLMIAVELDCSSPTAVEPTSWGRVKAMYR